MNVPERPTDPAIWQRLRDICHGLPDVTSKLSHGELAWSVGTGRKARQFATTWDHHHGSNHNSVLFAAAPGEQDTLVGEDPQRYFVPPYYGPGGWVGVHLDLADVDWDRVELHLTDAHDLKNPAR